MANAGGHDFRKQSILFKLRERLKEFAHPYFVEFGNIVFVDNCDVFVEPVSYVSTLIKPTPKSILPRFNNYNDLEYFIAARLEATIIHEKLTNS